MDAGKAVQVLVVSLNTVTKRMKNFLHMVVSDVSQ